MQHNIPKLINLLKLRNVKCSFIVKQVTLQILNNFFLKRKNYILRLGDKICLTIYPKSLHKIHVTGISNKSDIEFVLSYFKSNNIKASKVQIDNTFWIVKPLLIPRFDKFATFCRQRQSTDSTLLDLSNQGLNGDGGFLNVIYLRLFSCKGTITIHRTCSLILGATNITSVKLLLQALEILINNYTNCLNSS